jgi:hypothetical protein
MRRESEIGIIVNGSPKMISANWVTYDAIVQLAGLVPLDDYSITYRGGPARYREGILAKGQSVELLPHMVFNVMHTGNA